jgi:hypothetical protein
MAWPPGQDRQAAAVAAAAHRPGLVDDGVADLAGGARGAGVQAPAEHQPGADAVGGLDVGHLGAALAGAPAALRERAQVGVVVGGDRQAEAPLELLRRAQADPAGQQGGVADHAGGPVQRPRQAGAHADHPPALHAGLAEDLLDQPGRGVQRLRGVPVDVELVHRLGQDAVAQVGDGHAQVLVAEVDADRHPGAGVQRDQHRGPAALRPWRLALAVADLGHHARGLQTGHQTGDGGAGQPRLARDLGPADRPCRLQDADHAAAVLLA